MGRVDEAESVVPKTWGNLKGRDQGDCGLRPAQAKLSRPPHLSKPSMVVPAQAKSYRDLPISVSQALWFQPHGRLSAGGFWSEANLGKNK
jgi:hypothetical protein